MTLFELLAAELAQQIEAERFRGEPPSI